jgi:PAS domain S-box-containing protein
MTVYVAKASGRGLEQCLAEIVDVAIAISGADFGNVQLLDPKTRGLRIVAQRGFPQWWLDFWETVPPGQGTCGTALELGKRVIVEDIERSPIFVGTPALEIQRRAGVRAVQSTPIVSRNGQPLGMFTTHYKAPFRPDARALQLLDLLALHAADIIERARFEEQGGELRRLEAALRASHADLVRAQAVAGVGSWRLDVGRDLLQWSEEEYRIFGVAPATPMTYAAFLARVHPEDRACVDREWNAALRGEPYDIEHRIIVNGDVRWAREKADLEFDANHALVGGIGVTLDITARKQRDAELLRERERLELALRGADLALWDWNVASGEVTFNARWAEMRGYRPEEIRGHVDSWISGVHPDDLERVNKVLNEHLEGRRPEYETEHRVRTKAGEWIWVLARGKVFSRNERGEPLRMAGTELDITSRKQAEEALSLAEAKWRGIISIAADAIISIDKDQRIVLFNEGAEKIFGYAKGEVVGAPIEMLIPERFRAIHRRHLERFAAGADVSRRMGDRRAAAIFGLRKNGEEFPADVAISKLEVANERMLTIVLRDITEEKRSERGYSFLAEVGPILATTLDYDETLSTIADLTVRYLADFCIVDIVEESGELRRLQARAREPAKKWVVDALLRISLDRTRPSLATAALQSSKPLLIEEVTPEMIASWAQNDEHLRALRGLEAKSIIAVPLLLHRKLLGILVLIASGRAYERADLRMAEALAHRAALSIENARLYLEAKRAIEARDNVLGVVAHDLRSPLSAIIMSASLLKQPGAQREPMRKKSAQMIERSAARMSRLIQDLLDVTRIEAGPLSMDLAWVSVAELLSECIESQKPAASSAAIELRLASAKRLPDRIRVDRHRILRVFENLIGNAIKFTPRGGLITVSAEAKGSQIVFSVRDTGCGISADDLPHVYDRFWQAREGRHGAGLGLAIVKGIVEAHGGRTWVKSAPGRGTTFFFTIAMSRAPVLAEASAHSTHSTHSTH